MTSRHVTLENVSDVQQLHDGMTTDEFCWISTRAPRVSHMRTLAEVFGIHELIVEDAVLGRQRPKFERYGDQAVLVLRSLSYSGGDGGGDGTGRPEAAVGEVQLILGQGFLISVTHGPAASIPDITTRLQGDLDRSFSPHSLLYAYTDDVVDNYLRIAEELEDDINALEDAVFDPDGDFSIQDVYVQMREVLTIRHAVEPLTPALKGLDGASDLFPEHDHSYMRDVLDHQLQTAARIDGYTDRLSGLIDVASARISLQQNTDMRKISAWAGVIAVPTLFTGFYGMNFVHMPELGTSWGYPAVIIAIVASVVLLVRVFRRNGWL